MECSICGNYSVSLQEVNRDRVCAICRIKLQPPELLLVRKWNSSLLQNPFTGKFLIQEFSWYQECGFDVRSHKIFFKKEENPDYSEVITLVFRGNTACNIVKPYNWPAGMPCCMSRVCAN